MRGKGFPASSARGSQEPSLACHGPASAAGLEKLATPALGLVVGGGRFFFYYCHYYYMMMTLGCDSACPGADLEKSFALDMPQHPPGESPVAAGQDVSSLPWFFQTQLR